MSRKSRANARAASKASSRAGATKVTAPASQIQVPRLLSQMLMRVGGSLTPRAVTDIFQQADNGYIWRQCDLVEEARLRDCHLSGILYRRENAASNVPWQIIPASEKKRDLKIALFAKRILSEMGEYTQPGVTLLDLPGTFAHLNSAFMPGFAACEVMWRKVDGYVVPIGTVKIGARRFIFSQLDGSLRWWDASGSSYAYPGIDLQASAPAGKFLIHRPRYNGAEGPREGMARPLMWAALFRSWGINDWLRLAELAWKPYRTGTYGRGSSLEDRNALEDTLEKLTSNGWASLPEGCNLKIEFAKGIGDAKNHEALVSFLASEESKLVLGATLTVEQGKTGAMALGNVHADVAKSLCDMDCRAIEATIRRQLIAPLIALNFGTKVPVPEFRFLTEEGADLEALSQALLRLGGANWAGIDISQRWVRDTFGIPEPEEGELLMGGKRYVNPADREEPKVVVAAPAQPGAPAQPEEPTDDAETTDGPPADEKSLMLAVQGYRLHQMRRAVERAWAATRSTNRVALDSR